MRKSHRSIDLICPVVCLCLLHLLFKGEPPLISATWPPSKTALVVPWKSTGASEKPVSLSWGSGIWSLAMIMRLLAPTKTWVFLSKGAPEKWLVSLRLSFRTIQKTRFDQNCRQSMLHLGRDMRRDVVFQGPYQYRFTPWNPELVLH